ncbi:hypothetical protein F5Y14DRAFT_447499 [Nemania sp. NC0429]|nr:hypothetical protein F5Y14DRAFT_447499 [Nemania sp. NC0429]
MSTNAAGRTVWNDKARSDLLLTIVDIAPPTTQQWEAIIAQVQTKGYTYNASAALQHLQKLKRKDGEASAPNTPSKPKPATPRAKRTPNSAAKKRKNQAVHDADKDDDEEFDVKKPKIDVDQYLKEEEASFDNDGEVI